MGASAMWRRVSLNPALSVSNSVRTRLNTSSRTSSRVNLIARHMTNAQWAAVSADLAHPPKHLLHLPDSPVQLLSNGSMRILQLNREKALNAIDRYMISLINVAFDEIEPSPNAATILFRGVGRSMCAGGDVMSLVTLADKEDIVERSKSVWFFQWELMQNYRVHYLRRATTQLGHPKTYIGLWDGIIMGGGVGMTVHSTLRIASERTLFAMPETAIGYYPDVGLTYVFSRLDGGVGMYIGLTSSRLSGADAYITGLATHYVRSHAVEEMIRRIGSMPLSTAAHEENVVSAINEFASDPFMDDPSLAQKSVYLGDTRIAMDYAFTRDSVEQIIAVLEDIAQRRHDSFTGKDLAARGLSLTEDVAEWASVTHATLLSRSPRSLKVTFHAIRLAHHQTYEENMHTNIRLSTAFCDLSIGRDFHTGVMHVLGKDPATGQRRTGTPTWEPSRLEDVSDDYIQTFFFGEASKAHRAGMQLEVPKLMNVPHTGKDREARKEREAKLRGLGPLRWNPKFNMHALPTEAELAALHEGSHPASGSYVLEANELLDTIDKYYQHKPGLRLKVQDWLDRRQRAQKA